MWNENFCGNDRENENENENFHIHLCAIVRVYSALDFHSDCEKLWENFPPTLSEKFSSEKYLNEIFLV